MNPLTNEATTTVAAGAGALVGTLLVIFLTLFLAFYILLVIADWKIFKKAGEKGWKSLIPIYNIYIMYKISGIKNWFWITLVATIVINIINTVSADPVTGDLSTFAIILSIIYVFFALLVTIYFSVRFSKAFGHGTGYAIGLIFLPNIFQLIIAFGSSKYDKKILKA